MAGRIRVQIYTMQTIAEAEAVAALGVDNVGVTPSRRGLPGEVDHALAAEICRAVAGKATSVALSVETDVEPIAKMVRAVKPDVLHLCGPNRVPSQSSESPPSWPPRSEHGGHHPVGGGEAIGFGEPREPREPHPVVR